jgi:hypothetical protein
MDLKAADLGLAKSGVHVRFSSTNEALIIVFTVKMKGTIITCHHRENEAV